MEKQLTIAHLAPYLPYGIEFMADSSGKTIITEMKVLANISGTWFVEGLSHSDYLVNIKPILRPLSLMTKEEMEWLNNEFISADLRSEYKVDVSLIEGSNDWKPFIVSRSHFMNQTPLPLSAYLKFFEWHFDVFGLIDAGLAVEKGGHV